MKTQIILGAFFLSASLLHSQSDTETHTVRIKKVQNINGTETISDTTYQVSGPITLKDAPGIKIEEKETVINGKPRKMVVVIDEMHGNDSALQTVKMEEVMDEQVKSALNASGIDGQNAAVDKVMVMNVEDHELDKNGEKKITKIIIIKKIKIIDPSTEDAKMLDKQTGLADGKLSLDKMDFYPNPNTGKFNLSFNLKDKGTTSVSILNMEGKIIYNETLDNFTGHYSKEIDISENPKGAYFVKVEQGKHAQLKKIVLE
ncbi:MAG: T9SS type A sorting domain-containing protein [bacterium]|nr:T9SS type A sorting domain-containing protein [bacterium]